MGEVKAGDKVWKPGDKALLTLETGTYAVEILEDRHEVLLHVKGAEGDEGKGLGVVWVDPDKLSELEEKPAGDAPAAPAAPADAPAGDAPAPADAPAPDRGAQPNPGGRRTS